MRWPLTARKLDGRNRRRFPFRRFPLPCTTHCNISLPWRERTGRADGRTFLISPVPYEVSSGLEMSKKKAGPPLAQGWGRTIRWQRGYAIRRARFLPETSSRSGLNPFPAQCLLVDLAGQFGEFFVGFLFFSQGCFEQRLRARFRPGPRQKHVPCRKLRFRSAPPAARPRSRRHP